MTVKLKINKWRVYFIGSPLSRMTHIIPNSANRNTSFHITCVSLWPLVFSAA